MSLETRIAELATTIAAQCNAIDAKVGRPGLDYIFSTTTSASDPGPGKLRLNHATPSSATAIYLDAIDSHSVDVRTFIQTWTAGGILKIKKTGSPSVFHIFRVTSLVTNVAGIPGNYWHNLSVSYLSGSGSISADDTLFIEFSHSGIAGVSYRDEKSSGSNGGNFNSGAWQTRTLNTESSADTVGASLASNEISLPAGTYMTRWSAPAYYVGFHQTRLYNVTDGTVVGLGSTEYARPDGSAHTSRSHGSQVFTISGTKSLRLEHRCSSSSAGVGFGYGCSFGTEVFSEISFIKLA